MSSIFLSHSSQDNELAGDLSRRLKERGYTALFLDFDPDSGIKAGRDWERELYRNLKLSGAVIVLCSSSSMASRWCFVEIAQAKALGKAIFPITVLPCRVENILNDRQVIDLTVLGVDEACRRLFDSLRAAGLDPEDSFHWDSKRPPFPGLNYFDAGDAGIYFGREEEVRQVIETLTRMQRQGEPRLLVVVGSSGSGKSSLVRAGVLPRLGKDRSHWALVDPFRPGPQPISELARSLFSAFPEGSGRPDWKAIRDRLTDESRAASPGEGPAARATSVLTEYADDLTMLHGRREASVLLVVDQAEELLRSVARDEASAFLNVLRRATERPGGRVFGLLTLRSDFLGSFQNHPALLGVAFADLPLGRLPVERFPQVIEGPADRAAIALEPGLVPSMIADARTDDALPLLAFTLREMYERCRDQERLTLKVYRDDLGGIKGAVARVVERIKTEGTWTSEVGRALRRAFLKLVRVNDEGQFTRQPCRWADLPDLAAPVLESFVKARLLSSNGDVVEVTHESLFRVWPELADWLDEGRELILWKKNIQDEVKAWIAHDRSPLYVLSGARVAEGRRWLDSNVEDFPGPEAEFITASIVAEDDRIAREQAQQEKLRWLARILAVAAVTACLIGVYAFVQRNEANKKAKAALTAEAEERTQRLIAEKATKQAKDQARIATSRQLAALSVSERNKNLDRSLLLAVEALRAETTIEARDSLYKALQAVPGLISLLHSSEGYVQDVAFSPDGKTIAAVYNDTRGFGEVVLWDVAAFKRLAGDPLPVKEGRVHGLAFSPDGKTIAAGHQGGTDGGGVVLWDVAARKRLADDPLPVTEGDVQGVAFSPDGKTIAAAYAYAYDGGGGGGGVVLWDVAARKRLVDDPLPVKESFVEGVAFSPDGKTIAAGYGHTGGAGGVVLWDVAARKRLADDPLVLKEGSATVVAFSPDGKTVAAGYDGGGVVLWDVATRKRLPDDQLPVAKGLVRGVAFSPDGKTIAAGHQYIGEPGVVLWDLAAHKLLADVPLPTEVNSVEGVAFSPDGKTIAAGYDFSGGGGAVVLWDVAGRKLLADDQLVVSEGVVTGVAFSPDSTTIAAGYGSDRIGVGGGVVLWDVAARKRRADYLLVPEGGVDGVAFSSDGRTVAAGYGAHGGGVVLWDVSARKRLADDRLVLKEGSVAVVAFSPDGKTIAAGYYGGGVVLWDVAARKRLADDPLPVEEGSVRGVAFSPDGKTIAAGYNLDGKGGVVLWDVAARQRLADDPLLVAEGNVQGVAFSPDGKTIAAGTDGYVVGGVSGVVLWDVAARQRLADDPLPVKEGRVRGVAFSPDGKTIAAGYSFSSGHGGGGVVLWDAAARQRLADDPRPVNDGHVVGVAFSPDGKTIAAGTDGYVVGGVSSVVLWDVDLDSWRRHARQIANRNFTRDEWRQVFPDEPYRQTFPDLPLPPEVPPSHAASPSRETRPVGRTK